VYSDKRRHSSGEEHSEKRQRKSGEENKKEGVIRCTSRLSSVKNTSSESSKSDSDTDQAGDVMTKDDIEKIVARVSQVLTTKYEESTNRIFEGLKGIQRRVNKIEDNDIRQDKEIDKIKHHMDDFDQKEKDKNVIVTGLKEDQLNKASLINILNDKLKKTIRNDDIDYVLNLRNARQGQPNRLRLVFQDKMKKDEIIKEKTKLKDTDIWLSDDLTKRRSELAYAARQAVKNGKINMTWVHDSKIFTKKKANDKPSILYDIEDLPN
jgi:hypothetical protein